ncbi:UNVERIFIED_CONTAM: Retrovirus-related Pol polyprotein from transposon TNT 1-94 [Sesamum latifolium]|uniref:Retrovirus-related Pol polyprotein from transposon TNT 1-94 n=1 Tax=Sesamum latifolium TaxID=2727402 RepID=A0AAW2X4S5_9LAMI
MIISLLLTSGLPKYLLGEALNTACHILNRVPLKHNTSTPFELCKGRKPRLKHFRVWGCLAKVLVPEHKRKKLGPKTIDVVFLGYVETSYVLRFLVIKSEIRGIEVNAIVEFRDAVFLEDVFPMKILSSVSLDDSLASMSIPEHVEKMSNVRVNLSSTSLTYKELDEPRWSKRARVFKNFGSDFVTYNIKDDSITFKDVMASSEAKQWKETAKSERDSIVSNGTWVLVDLRLGCTTIGCKWIFKKNLKPEGTVDKCKARLVAKALALVYNLPIHQIDVKTFFLYGELEEEIYMNQPEGFVVHDKFELKDMGEADIILRIKLIRSIDGIAISQSHYVEKIIEKFGYQNSRIAKTPYDSSVVLFKNESGVAVAQLRYTSCLDRTHWGALDRVLRYLNGTVSLVIHNGRFPTILEGYSDTSWIAKNSGSNGCLGYVFTLCGGLVSWKSTKQTLITRSTFEVELCALDMTGIDAKWLFRLLSQLPIVSQPLPLLAIHCDS